MALEWRDNLHNFVAYLLYEGNKQKIPNCIIDAIDSAYLQGLEENENGKLSTMRDGISTPKSK